MDGGWLMWLHLLAKHSSLCGRMKEMGVGAAIAAREPGS